MIIFGSSEIDDVFLTDTKSADVVDLQVEVVITSLFNPEPPGEVCRDVIATLFLRQVESLSSSGFPGPGAGGVIEPLAVTTIERQIEWGGDPCFPQQEMGDGIGFAMA